MNEIAVLDTGLSQLPLALPKGARAQLLDYLQLLQKWNSVHNLTAVRDPSEQVKLHILDALAVLPVIDAPVKTAADVGSGAGIPGLMFAIAKPDWQLTLVEANSKKAAFLREAVRVLGLNNVHVHGGRAEALKPAQPFDLIASRAVAQLDDFLDFTGHLGGAGSIWGLMKAHDDEPLTTAGYAKTAVKPVAVPLLEAPRLWIEVQQQ